MFNSSRRAGIKELCKEVWKASYEMNKIGVNLNQIAKAANYAAKKGRPLPHGSMYVFHIGSDLMDIPVRYEKASGKAGEALCRILA